MTKGWVAEFIQQGRRRHVNIAEPDQDIAEQAIRMSYPNVGRILMQALEHGELKHLGLSKGDLVETRSETPINRRLP